MTTPTYTPEPGHQVVVRRYEVPCPELPGYAERKLTIELAGVIATVRGLSDGHLITLEGMTDAIFTGYQFSGQDPEHGCSWSLLTVVIPAGEVQAYDQAELAAKVSQAEREHAAALARWESARDVEVVARQRLTGAHERVEAALAQAARHQADLDAAKPAFGNLSERRKADRARMAWLVADLACKHGLKAVITANGDIRSQSVEITGPHTLALTVTFQGNSPQAAPDTYVLSWHMRPWADEGKGWQLNPAAFGTVNPHHGTKATDMAYDFNALITKLARRFAAIEDGSAFVQLDN